MTESMDTNSTQQGPPKVPFHPMEAIYGHGKTLHGAQEQLRDGDQILAAVIEPHQLPEWGRMYVQNLIKEPIIRAHFHGLWVKTKEKADSEKRQMNTPNDWDDAIAGWGVQEEPRYITTKQGGQFTIVIMTVPYAIAAQAIVTASKARHT